MQLALLATIQTASLKLTPPSPDFAHSVWLGGAGLSVCGVFIVQYFPIKAFNITDEDMKTLVQDGNPYIKTSLLAIAIASPVVIALWASLLFIAGVIDYIVQAEFSGNQYRVFTAIPVGFGVVTMVLTLIIGEIVGRRVAARVGQHRYRLYYLAVNSSNIRIVRFVMMCAEILSFPFHQCKADAFRYRLILRLGARSVHYHVPSITSGVVKYPECG